MSGFLRLAGVELTAAPQQHHGQHNAQQSGSQRYAYRGPGRLPENGLLQDGHKIEVQPVNDNGQQRRQQQQQRQRDQDNIADAAVQAVLRIAPAGYLMTTCGNGFTQPLAQQHQHQTARHLDYRQQRGATGIVVVTQRLVNRQLNGGGLRPAAK